MESTKETIEDTTKTLIQTLANIGVTWEDETELIDLLNCHVNGVIEELALTGVGCSLPSEQESIKIYEVEYGMFCAIEWAFVYFEIKATSIDELKAEVMTTLQYMREDISILEKWERIEQDIIESELCFPLVTKHA